MKVLGSRLGVAVAVVAITVVREELRMRFVGIKREEKLTEETHEDCKWRRINDIEYNVMSNSPILAILSFKSLFRITRLYGSYMSIASIDKGTFFARTSSSVMHSLSNAKSIKRHTVGHCKASLRQYRHTWVKANGCLGISSPEA